MGEVRKVEIELSEQLAQSVDAAIQSGEYADLSEILTQELTFWSIERKQRLADLRAAIDEGLASGAPKEITPGWFDDVLFRAQSQATR
ncbi:MAG: type II toxin-antitoxin system ParD family antitoxin [Proteobacteria bacterium]|nr:type II toxin-antitoxin system ParD family antitoxin [Pseudomonadota bacterium]